ncbi:hypothetical protein ACWT_6466 [Actinoplanes sp. SE50]|uniref:hypothetical protein n=1 Tax=unclassified Actinoplanes TaxID=2626549 RepID=UPI00023EBFC3|nr:MULTISPECIES: hypothetical protein [unclassified Actinoplanes]AEV87479.1 hypothetical protein ACPL_6597 [Actinoplanes sp. SE50/110]ATO85881.1 hypothetical protein ACWT_6466 [Actinoplanes sp. SE50]SLM03295.1 hypothetical protein ACSP50_6584 [Actinoplanes sp. SE50/110]
MTDLLDPESDLSGTQAAVDAANGQLHEIMDRQTDLQQSAECSGTHLDRWYY